MLVVNTLTALSYFAMGEKIMARYPHAPSGIAYVYGVGCLINVAIVICLFWWQKWAFYAFCILAIAWLGINFYVGLNTIAAFAGLLGPLVLYGVFQIGGDDKGWKYLK